MGGKAKIVSVQGLRAVAAICILIRHAGFQTPLVLAGGVDLFFVISGFIMVTSCWGEFGREGAWRRFSIRRVLRIVPLYWLATLLMLFVVAYQQHALPDTAKIFKSLFFYPFPTDVPILPAGWTLNFEMFFYSIFAFALVMRPRWAVITVSVLLVATVLFGHALGPVSRNSVTFPLSLEFILGMAIGVGYSEGVRLTKPIAVTALAIGFSTMAMAPEFGWVSGTDDPMRVLGWGVPAGLVLAGATLTEWSWRPLISSPLMLLGDSSYALYVFHQPLILILYHSGYSGNSWPAVVAVCILSSIFIHFMVERPIISWAKRRSREERAKAVLVTPSARSA